MATYILLTKLAPENMQDLSKIEDNGINWKHAVEEKCPGVNFLAHYSILGPYDFLSIFEAPNEQMASKVSMISMSLGAQKAESWTAIPYPEFIRNIHELLE